MKLAIFDFDSTLMDGETIDFLAKELGVKKEVSHITTKAMAGELDFFESLQTRVKLLKGLDYKKVIEICSNLPIMNGAKDTIKELKKMDYKIVCFSGGFTTATVPMCKKIGIDTQFANILHTKNDILTGCVGGYMMFNSSKGDMIQKLQNILKISSMDTLVVGDGANDVSMFKYASKKVAFCANDILKDKANIIIEKKDLRLILEKV
jgi:phosphoserine phosphatase